MSDSAKDVLLVVSTLGHAEESAAYAIERAAETGARLQLLLVCESEPASLADRLSEESWMGDRVGAELAQALSQDRRTRGYRALSGIARDAHEEEVPTETNVVDGELDAEIRKFAESHPVAQVVVSLPAPGLFARFFPGRKEPPAKRLERSLGVPVTVFEYR